MHLKQFPSRRQFIQNTSLAIGVLEFPSIVGAAVPAKIKIGQIGTTHAHALGKLTTIRSFHDLYELVGVVEPDAKRRDSFARNKTFTGVKWINEEELLNTKGLKAVAVETDVRDLVPAGIRCLRAGMHIHLDKPAGISMGPCRQLHAEAIKRKLTIQMGYMLRYNPGFELLFQFVRDGWLGDLTELSGMMGKRAGAGLRKQLEEFEGGGMFELACHIIDAMVTVLGKPGNVTSFNHRTYPDKDTFADNQMAVFDYPKTIATIRCNHLDPFGGPRRQFNVTGEYGTFEIRPMEPPSVRIALDRDRGKFKKGWQDVELPRSNGRYDGDFLDLAKIIRGEKKLAWDSKHDLAVHETVLRACGMKVDA